MKNGGRRLVYPVGSQPTSASSLISDDKSTAALPLHSLLERGIRGDGDLDLELGAARGQGHGQLGGIELAVRLAVDGHRGDLDASLGQDVRLHAQDVVLEAVRLRREVEIHRLLGDQQVGVDRREVGQLARMVRTHRVAALGALGAEQVGQAVGQHVEVHAAGLGVEEPRVVECRGFAGQLEVLRVAGGAVHDEVREDALLLLPPRLAVVEGEAVVQFAIGELTGDHIVPAAALLIHADLGHAVGQLGGETGVLALLAQRVHARQVPRDLEVVADHRAVLLPAPGLVGAPVVEELLLHERAAVLGREVLHDGVEGQLQEVRVLLFAGGEPQVDEVGRGVVADRVPVLARLVVGEARILCAPGVDGDVVVVATERRVVAEVLVEEVDRALDVVVDAFFAGDAIGLRRTREGVDLLVQRDGVPVVAEQRAEVLLQPALGHFQRVQPVDHAFARLVALGGLVAEVLGALVGGFEEAVLTGQQVGRGETVDGARDGVDLLQAVVGLVAVEREIGAVFVVIDLSAFELRLDVEVGDLADLLDPPVLVLEAVAGAVDDLAGELEVLGLERQRAVLGIDDAVGEDVLPGDQQLLDVGADPALAEIADRLAIGVVVQTHGVEVAAGRLDHEAVGSLVDADDVAGDEVGVDEGRIRHGAVLGRWG